MLIPKISFRWFLYKCASIAIHVVTFLYYRLFHFNTLQPIRRIAHCTSDPRQTGRLVRLLVLWRTRKVIELQYISIAVRFLLKFAL